MDAALRYRAELADQFVAYLDRLTIAQWRDLVRLQWRDDAYFRLSRELATEAMQLLGAERTAQYDAVLTERRARVAAMLRRLETLEPDVAESALDMTGAALQALLVRDCYGFNAGAFGELIAPFRPYVDLPELERTATRIVTPTSVARQPSEPVPPPDQR
jgi:hypothetical protein